VGLRMNVSTLSRWTITAGRKNGQAFVAHFPPFPAIQLAIRPIRCHMHPIGVSWSSDRAGLTFFFAGKLFEVPQVPHVALWARSRRGCTPVKGSRPYPPCSRGAGGIGLTSEEEKSPPPPLT
jgi:hypothetical protein